MGIRVMWAWRPRRGGSLRHWRLQVRPARARGATWLRLWAVAVTTARMDILRRVLLVRLHRTRYFRRGMGAREVTSARRSSR